MFIQSWLPVFTKGLVTSWFLKWPFVWLVGMVFRAVSYDSKRHHQGQSVGDPLVTIAVGGEQPNWYQTLSYFKWVKAYNSYWIPSPCSTKLSM